MLQNVRRSGLFFIILISVWGSTDPANSAQLVLSDFDGTFSEFRAENKGAFETRMRLFKIQTRGNTFESLPAGDDYIDVTHDDFTKLIPFLAHDGQNPKNKQKTFTLQNGQVIVPGYYFVMSPESFKFFRPNPYDLEHFYLIEDFKASQIRAASGEKTWQGPFFPFAQRVLSTPIGAKSFSIVTMRGHSPAEWTAYFELLKQQSLIQFVPPVQHFHSLGAPKYDIFGPLQNSKMRKVGLLREAILSLSRVPATEEVLSPNGDRYEKMNTLIFADDTQEIIDGAALLFQSFAKQRRVNVKLVLFNSGIKTEVLASGRPQFAVVKSDGSFRPWTEDENNRFFNHFDCQGLLTGDR